MHDPWLKSRQVDSIYDLFKAAVDAGDALAAAGLFGCLLDLSSAAHQHVKERGSRWRSWNRLYRYITGILKEIQDESVIYPVTLQQLLSVKVSYYSGDGN